MTAAMERHGWTGYGEEERVPTPPVPPPDSTGMDADEVAKVINDLLGSIMEPQWRERWWDAEIYDGQTPRQMLEGNRFRQLWMTAEATASLDARDITDIEHMRD